jgi:hypothetical protein
MPRSQPAGAFRTDAHVSLWQLGPEDDAGPDEAQEVASIRQTANIHELTGRDIPVDEAFPHVDADVEVLGELASGLEIGASGLPNQVDVRGARRRPGAERADFREDFIELARVVLTPVLLTGRASARRRRASSDAAPAANVPAITWRRLTMAFLRRRVRRPELELGQ